MNYIVYVCLYTLKKGDGISKKIFSQVEGFSKENSQCDIVYLNEMGICHSIYINGIKSDERQISNEKSEKELLKYCEMLENVSFYYLRMTNPKIHLLRFIKNIKKANKKIAFEIPTYPFFYEQFHVSKNKLKGILKIICYKIYLPIVYSLVDKIFVVKARKNIKLNSKMVSIYNGISDNIIKINRNSFSLENLNEINFIGVGTIYSYHGYDKLIKALYRYNKKGNDNKKNIIFHIVGSGKEIPKLKKLVEKLNLTKNVIFHGVLYGEKLEMLYQISNIGVGTLALEKRHADIDTALKNVEYFSKQLYVISSGKIFDVSDKYYFELKSNTKINIDKILENYEIFLNQFISLNYDEIYQKFKWSTITKDIKKMMGI